MTVWEFKRDSKAYCSILESTAFLNIWEGAVRSGKTVASLVRFVWELEKTHRSGGADGGQIVMIGKTLDTLRRNILEPLTSVEPNFLFNVFSRTATYKTLKIQLVGANDARSEQKIRGMTILIAYCDEGTLIDNEFFNMLVTRLSMPCSILFVTTNPDSPRHWLKTQYIDAGNADIKTFHFEMKDNPFLTDDYIRRMSEMYTGLWRRRFIQGEWVAAEGAVFDMFTSDMIRPCPFVPVRHVVGVDYGAQNATVFVLIATDFKAAHVAKTFYHSGRESQQTRTSSQYALDLKKFVDGVSGLDYCRIDPSATGFIQDCLQLGLPVLKANNAVVDGIRFVSSLMSRGLFTVSPGCKELIQQIYGYRWDEKKALQGVDAPVKQDDDAVDAMRYGIFSLRHQLLNQESE